ncbi:MAG: protein kinase domain-containing protein [Oscillochloridaceae bacterium umkhey_bin13]
MSSIMDRTLPPGLLIHQRYQVVRKIGQGGMGAVYAAIDSRLRVTVALKQLLVATPHAPSCAHEARLLAGLRHPALPTVSDYFVDADAHFLVMQYIDGEDLGDLLAWQTEPLSVERVLGWADQVLDVVIYLHEQTPPVIHRDIKPRNLKLTADERVMLLDFGLAKGMAALDTQTATRASIFGYTPQYAPLEQIHGSGTDVRSDVYALAGTLYHLLTRVPPPDALTRAAALVAKQADPLRPPDQLVPQIPKPLGAALLQALALSADERPASVAAFRSSLLAAVALQATIQLVVPPPPVAPRRAPAAEAPTPEILLYAVEDAAVAAQEDDRRRMAGLLQQRIAEPLSLLLAQAGAYEQVLGTTPTTRLALGTLVTLISQVLQQVRDLGESLQPNVLEASGLEAALDGLAAQFMRSYGLTITVQVEQWRERPPRQLELALYRAAQEILERATHHTRATRVHLALARDEAQLRLRVLDDGMTVVGGDVLLPAQQRLAHLGGQLAIRPAVQGGTLVEATLPLPQPIHLTTREHEVLQLLAQGQSNKQIAAELQLSPRTINFHLDNIYAKLGVNSRIEAAIYALRYL